jgi:predicted SnoaL-like aldol condensation-catalyzing enzyme
MLMDSNHNVSAHKQAAVQFLQLVVAGDIDHAYQRYVDMQGKHHNPSFPAGFPALKQAMIENYAQFPNKQLNIKNVLGDGDLVTVHSHIILALEQKGIVAVHIFRFSNDRIVELWDYGQPVAEDSPNQDGMF